MGNAKKAALHNLGCKVNAYETEAMRQLLEEGGYEIVPFADEADVYVVNTCSVTNIADRKSRQMVHRARKQNPAAVIVAAGCYAQTREAEAAADSAVDIVIGNNQKGRLVELLERWFRENPSGRSEGGTLSAVLDINCGDQPYEELSVPQPTEHTRAFLKVQDGCNQFCSYCIIPYARGRVRSRPVADVLAEARRLGENGYKELVLTGIHLSSYGVDCGEDLLHLIQAVHEVDGIKRIRLGSLEPKIVTEEFVQKLSEMPKICPHFHLSLQSGCDATLARMNRRYTAEEYAAGCAILRKYFVHPAITTDVIVGFPGETEEEFEETKAFLERIHFYEMHIFKYSRRKGTRAATMPQQITEEVKTARSEALLALARQMSVEFREYYLGRQASVLLEERQVVAGRTMLVGYTPEYVKAAYESAEIPENTIVSGRLTELLDGEIYRMT